MAVERKSLFDSIMEEQAGVNENDREKIRTEKKDNRIKDMIDTNRKDKIITVKVNSQMWMRFRKMCSMNGSTANGMINQMVHEYVYENEKKFEV